MRYYIHSAMVVSVGVEVEADSPEQAREIAEDTGIRSLCHACSGSDHGRRRDEWHLTDGLEGEPATDKTTVTLRGFEITGLTADK